MVLVTGGTGFIGSRVTRKLLSRGEAALVFDVRPVPAALGDLATHPDLRIVEGDVSQLDDLLRAMRAHGVERVIHLAAALRDAIDRAPLVGVRVNIAGTTNVFEAARTLGSRRVVYASSMVVHGDQSRHGDAAIDEDSPVFPPSLYAHTKLLNEATGRHYLELLDVDCRGLRVCSPIGCGRAGRGAGGAVSRMMTAAARGVPVRVPYRAEQELPYIYIEDVAEILVRLCFADRLSRPVYVSTARSVSFAEIAGIAARLVPGAEVAFGDGDRIGHVSRIDGSRLEADLDYPLPPVAARVRDHLNAVRAADGRQPVG